MADKNQPSKKTAAHRETLEILDEISTLLDTGLDRKQLAYCVVLIDNGVNPEALATIMKELRAKYPKEETESEASA